LWISFYHAPNFFQQLTHATGMTTSLGSNPTVAITLPIATGKVSQTNESIGWTVSAPNGIHPCIQQDIVYLTDACKRPTLFPYLQQSYRFALEELPNLFVSKA